MELIYIAVIVYGLRDNAYALGAGFSIGNSSPVGYSCSDTSL